MTAPALIQQAIQRFDAITARERILVTAAVLAGVLIAWNSLFMQPLAAKQSALTQRMLDVQQTIEATANEIETDPVTVAVTQQKALEGELATMDKQLSALSVQLIPPQRMVEVIHEVLKHHPGIELVSLRNEPVKALVAPVEGQSQGGPYVHSVELIVEGSYFDTIRYLRALETLPWRFQWQSLELNSLAFPRNRVRIELNTLSMEKEWLGV